MRGAQLDEEAALYPAWEVTAVAWLGITRYRLNVGTREEGCMARSQEGANPLCHFLVREVGNTTMLNANTMEVHVVVHRKDQFLFGG